MHPMRHARPQKPVSAQGSCGWPLSAVLLVVVLLWSLALTVLCWLLGVRVAGGPYDASTFGTVGEWASGIGTALAVLGAFVIFRRESSQAADLLRHSQQELAVALSELQFQQQEYAQRQAELVSAWLECANTVTAAGLAWPDEDQAIGDWNAGVAALGWKRHRLSPPEWIHDELGTWSLTDWRNTDSPFPIYWFPAVLVSNTSGQPVYHVQVSVSAELNGAEASAWDFYQMVLPPSTAPLPLRVPDTTSLNTSATERDVQESLKRLRVSVLFRDSGGRVWLRNEKGILERRDVEASAEPTHEVTASGEPILESGPQKT